MFKNKRLPNLKSKKTTTTSADDKTVFKVEHNYLFKLFE